MPLSSAEPPVRSPFFGGERRPVELHGHLAGAPLFLVLNGPSIMQLDLDRLRAPGVVTLCINNGPRAFRPDLWLTCDPPRRFLPSIWRDPRILKFARAYYYDYRIRPLESDVPGESETVSPELLARDCPRVVWFEDSCRRFDPDTFLTADKVVFGDREVRSSMLAALRVAHLLGVRELYLLGCDFHMERERPYGFYEPVSERHVEKNNRYYELLSERFERLLPHFRAHGLEVFNCNPESGLRVFPFLPFEEALARVTGPFARLIERERDQSFYFLDPARAKVRKIDPQASPVPLQKRPVEG